MEFIDCIWVMSDGWNLVSFEFVNMNVSEGMLEGLLSFFIRFKKVEDFEKFV